MLFLSLLGKRTALFIGQVLERGFLNRNAAANPIKLGFDFSPGKLHIFAPDLLGIFASVVVDVWRDPVRLGISREHIPPFAEDHAELAIKLRLAPAELIEFLFRCLDRRVFLFRHVSFLQKLVEIIIGGFTFHWVP
jgi:hypothetical protein